MEYAYIKEDTLFLHWFDNEPQEISVNVAHHKFFVKINDEIRFYVCVGKHDLQCHVYECKDGIYDNDNFYSAYYNHKLIECGIRRKSSSLVLKEFDEEEMTEYYNEKRDGKYIVDPDKRVYHGSYEYNPKKHFPRKDTDKEDQMEENKSNSTIAATTNNSDEETNKSKDDKKSDSLYSPHNKGNTEYKI